MSYAIDRVAAELHEDLERYGIVVKPGSRAIIYSDWPVRILDPYTDARKCRKILKEYIKHGKAKVDAANAAKQGRLL